MHAEKVRTELKNLSRKVKISMGITKNRTLSDLDMDNYTSDNNQKVLSTDNSTINASQYVSGHKKHDSDLMTYSYNDQYDSNHNNIRSLKSKNIRAKSKQEFDLVKVKQKQKHLKEIKQNSIERMQERIRQQIEGDKLAEEQKKQMRLIEVRRQAQRMAERRLQVNMTAAPRPAQEVKKLKELMNAKPLYKKMHERYTQSLVPELQSKKNYLRELHDKLKPIDMNEIDMHEVTYKIYRERENANRSKKVLHSTSFK